ncbi:cation transporter, partial [Candidatus Darwinibacter acetoxidans]
MRLVYHLQGLDCAACAAKIETAASRLQAVQEAVVDFPSSRIFLEIGEGDKEAVKRALQEVVTAVEPGITITEQRAKRAKPELLNPRNVSLALALLSFLAALLVSSSPAKTALYLTAYALAGFEIIAAAASSIRRGMVFDENFLMA